jgi:hypothetical protein
MVDARDQSRIIHTIIALSIDELGCRPLPRLGIFLQPRLGTAKLGHSWIALKDQDSTMLLCESLGRRERIGVPPQRTIKKR